MFNGSVSSATSDLIESRTIYKSDYRLTLPTIDELRRLWTDSTVSSPPTGWATHHYLTATEDPTSGGKHYIATLASTAGAYGIGDDQSVEGFVIFEVDDLVNGIVNTQSSINEGEYKEFFIDVNQDTYWKTLYRNQFDADSGLSAYSSVTVEGDAQSQAISNPAGTIASYPKAVYFDGDGDGLVINDSKLSQVGTNNFKISFAFKTDGTQDAYSVLLSRFVSRDGNFLEIGNGPSNSTGGLFAATANTQTVLSPLTDFNDDQWHYVEFFRQGKTLTLRVDGTDVNSVTGTTIDSLDLNGIRLGRWQGNNATDNNFKGWIDDFVVSVEEDIPITSAAITYAINGAESTDFVNAPSFTGTFSISESNFLYNGKTFYFPRGMQFANDELTEGTETMSITVGGKTQQFTVNDTSIGSKVCESSITGYRAYCSG